MIKDMKVVLLPFLWPAAGKYKDLKPFARAIFALSLRDGAHPYFSRCLMNAGLIPDPVEVSTF